MISLLLKYDTSFISKKKFEINEKSLGTPSKKNRIFHDIVQKGGWIAVSKPNFFYIRNGDIYIRRVGIRLIY